MKNTEKNHTHIHHFILVTMRHNANSLALIYLHFENSMAEKKKAAKKSTKKAAKKSTPVLSSDASKDQKPTKDVVTAVASSPAVQPKIKVIPKKLELPGGQTTAPAKRKKVVFKMTPFIEKQHKRLLDLKDEFINAIEGISKDTIRSYSSAENSATGLHQGDAGSDAYDRDYALAILAKEQDALYEIERAIHRIETGTYGICQMSGEEIPEIRLEVLPFARLTVECQSLWESKKGKKRYTIREGANFTEQL
jgi:DnaK suppressor protein